MKTLASIHPVMLKYGVTCSPEEFQRVVNLAFHRAESEVYDSIHRCMWSSLPRQFDLLMDDALAAGPFSTNNLVVLDVGCGTGLASELLLKTRIGANIREVHLLDTSAEMLAKAQNRAKSWPVKTVFIQGGIKDLPPHEHRYDVVVVCSVLHHIPDLAEFFREIRSIQARSGLLLHLQDPNGDFLGDPVLARRITELAGYSTPSLPPALRRFHPRRLFGKLHRMVTGKKPHDYIEKVNDELLTLGIVRTPMTDNDMWRITDIHDHDGVGISMNALRSLLPDYDLISQRSYSFFGAMSSELPKVLQRKEEELVKAKELNGMRIAALWRLKSES